VFAHYESLLAESESVWAGDFNSNPIWNKPKREGNHSALVSKFETYGITSVYHEFFGHTQGSEQPPTLYLHRHQDKPYHLDYCFASRAFMNVLKKVEVGTYDYWRQHSDHSPLIV